MAKVEVFSPQISGPSPNTKTRILSINRTQSTAVIGLPTGHNTLRRHFHLGGGLTNSPLYGRCGAEEETSAPLYVSVKLWLHSNIHIWAPFSCTQRTLRVQVWGPSGTLAMEQGSLKLVSGYGAQRAHFKP